MKKTGFLIEPIAAMANLEMAYYKAQRGKSAKYEVLTFAKNLDINLKRLQEQILTGEAEVGDYRYFTIYDPKKRQICAAPFPQRVLHHALMNVCHPFFERQQIFDSYASRIGKGTYAALERAEGYSRKYAWYLKLDVRRYFDNIHHGVLRSQLCRLFKDPYLLRIFDRILDSYEVLPGCGVPIGNLTSQYFANHYLVPADHYARETLKIPAYVRYMDDMVLWHNDKNMLIKIGLRFQAFIQEALKQDLKAFCMNKSVQGLPFLGYLLYPDVTRLTWPSRKRYIKKINKYHDLLIDGAWTQQEFQNHTTPLTAFTKHADAKAFRRKVHSLMGF